MPDIEKIKKHLAALTEAINNLEKHSNITAIDLKSSLDLLWIIERGIYLSLQNLFDMMAHIVSADFNTKWDSYADIADILLTNNLISSEDQKLLINMAGFRNRLSHDYLSLDTEILINIISKRIRDIRRFAKIISDYCQL